MLKLKPFDLLLGGSALLLILGAVMVAPNGHVEDVAILPKFWTGMAVMGTGFVLSWGLPAVPVYWFWGVAIAARLLLFPMEPGDDVWRYLWEGHIQNLGFSPYQFAPNAPELEPYRTAWWGRINHSDVSAIYPPLTQLGFRAIAAISLQVSWFKGGFVLADLFVCGLLSQRFGPLRATLYAWNPVIIYSFAGGAHYDSWFLLPLVAAWLVVDREPSDRRPWDWLSSAVLVGLSVAVKWMSLPMLGFLMWRSLRRFQFLPTLGIGLIGILPMVLFALPFCQAGRCRLIPTGSVFVNYGRSAELIPYWVAKIWDESLQANWLYLPPLALFTIWLILRARSFRNFAEWYWLALLTLTPIVHLWYFAWMVPFAVPSQNWGVRFVSLSAFIYFVLPSRIPDWRLTESERLILWLPLLVGWLWTFWQESRTLPLPEQPPSSPLPP